MIIYELTNGSYEPMTCLPQIVFTEDSVYRSSVNDNELKLEYDLEDVPFDINRSYFSILLQDINNNIPCGMLFVSVPVGEEFDTIIYIVRFGDREFEKIKNFYLTKFPK